ncbi:NAD-dependent epimerase/dehydratase family protein [Clostridium weizhouense]|uniref:NAD(P)-dependent oxidoreductase n=1 Tax=Clostridium weizhouense TaxID=2859781 RepID=A0ABS7AIT2_9CLOT|nr:NAD(P)-dependent oxidoreductase [Clostridium weizhouense]MBW6408573.1 NAD(P)-dependent oxidoreductase [Clostridium weizhouense]
MKKRILLTGGTGYVGKNIILELGSKYDFINLGRNSTNLCKSIIWTPNTKLEINEEIDTVIHGASVVGNTSLDFSEYVNANIKFTSDLLDFCTHNNVKNFIYLSTGGVYGFKEGRFKEDDKCNPEGIYNLSKKFSEDLCLLKSNSMRVVIYRLFFPYGLNQKGRLFDNIITNIINQKRVVLNKDGRPIINPIYIDDLIKIIDYEIQSNNEGIFNISGMEEVSIKDIVLLMNKYLKIPDLNYIYNNNNVSNLLGENKKIIKSLNYNFKNNIDKSIKKIIETYRKI